MNAGWICLHRSLQEHYLWNEKPYDKARAWIDLLLLASYEDKKIMYKGQLKVCERGTVNRSIKWLADRWGWDRRKVDRFLAVLESDGMLTVNSTSNGTTLTLINYEKFQGYSTSDGTSDGTTSAHQTVQQVRTYNNINNINNDNNISAKHKKTKFTNFTERVQDLNAIAEEIMENQTM